MLLSSFISYRPKRKTKTTPKISSPFPSKKYTWNSASPHPYASPRIIDIHDERAPEPSGSTSAGTPQVKLDVGVELKSEPLADWFPSGMLGSEPFTLDLDGAGARGSGVYHGSERGVERNGTLLESEDEEEDSSSSAGDVLANLEAMGASSFVNTPWKKPAPTPIQIPNASLHNPKVHLVRSTSASRPTSQLSSPESSAISGTTLARALIANTFVLSGSGSDVRSSRHLSTLTRTDSATLPRSEFMLVHSPYWRDTLSSSEMMSLSPPSAPPVPPVPDNAERVYVPPQTPRDRGSPPDVSGSMQDSENTRRMSRITEASTSTQSFLPLDSKPPLDDPAQSPSPSSKSPADEAATSPSPDLDNVLDYYSVTDTPERGVFRLPFSPITEESSSQLSPPTPYRRPESASSKRSVPPGRFFLGTTPSVRGNRDSISKSLLPIGERPTSSQLPPIPGPSSINTRLSGSPPTTRTPPPPSLATLSSDTHHLLPPPVSTIFNRMRSGSAPSPIRVVRDSRDLSSYSITITPRTDDASSSTPSTGNSVAQEFPETPSAFSPGFSPGIGLISSGGFAGAGGVEGNGVGVALPTPEAPMSAAFGRSIQPSLAQQMLLTRAATSVHGARHSRQASLGRVGRTGVGYARPSGDTGLSASAAELGNVKEWEGVADGMDGMEKRNGKGKEKEGDVDGPAGVQASETGKDVEEPSMKPDALPSSSSAQLNMALPPPAPPKHPLPSTSQPPTTSTQTHTRLEPGAPSAARLPSHGEGSTVAYGGGGGETASIHSYGYRQESFAANSRALSRSSGSLLAQAAAVETTAAATVAAATALALAAESASTPDTQAKRRIQPAPPTKGTPPAPPPQPLENVASSNNTNANNLGFTSTSRDPATVPPASQSQSQSRPPFMISLPPSHAQLPPSQLSASSLYSYSHSYDASLSAPLGSPPPYYTVVNHRAEQAGTPSTSGSYDPNYRFGQAQTQTPPPNAGEFGTDPHPTQQGHLSRRHHPRFRPPLPAGPRRPGPSAMRDRGGSVSSVASNTVRRLNPLPSPKFSAAPQRRFRGYTLDAAKWTFTSTQLQAIVSRAIRQSFQASSIRLLRLETLDEDIPEEMERLEVRREDVKVRYGALARRRAGVLEALAGCVVDGGGGGGGVDQEGAMRLVEDLKEVSGAMDRLAEELHSLDEQIAQVNQVCHVHSASALAMALRKLNKSFLNKWAEAQELRRQVETLEAERDEAWKQAEDVAAEYDELRRRVAETTTPDDGQNRYNRVAAVRQSSLRASRAGLRSASHHPSSIHRASTGSNGRGVVNPPSSARTTILPEEIPPVPPIPRRRPVNIQTNIPVRHSLGVPTSGPTPTSETRAMVHAQEELYEMLGITVHETRSRRSRSVIGLPAEAEPQPGSPSLSYYDPPLTTGRRASLPGSAAAAPDAYNAFSPDVDIILTSDRSGWI